MTKREKIQKIIDYFDEHMKFQKLVYGWELDEKLLNNLTIKELDDFLRKMKI